MTKETLEKLVVEQADTILCAYESEGEEKAYKLWQKLDHLTTGKRKLLSTEVFDLITQLEFFMEKHPESELGDLLRALYLARVALAQKK